WALSKPIYPISRKVFEGGRALGQAKLSNEIAKSVEELNASQKDLERVYTEQTKAIENAWPNDKLSLVPGDLLLDGVCQAFGVRFRKEVDSSRIAVLVDAGEIDAEIQEILREIGKI